MKPDLGFQLDHPRGDLDQAKAQGVELRQTDFTDVQAIASIARITGGNFRLLHRTRARRFDPG